MATRIKDSAVTAAKAEKDDYILLDGATNGSRKILVNIMGDESYDYASLLSLSLDSRGVYSNMCTVSPVDISDLTTLNGLKLQAYLVGSTSLYPLLITKFWTDSYNRFIVNLKSVNSSVQSTSTPTVSGTLHIIAPFEINSVGSYM